MYDLFTLCASCFDFKWCNGKNEKIVEDKCFKNRVYTSNYYENIAI